MAQRWSWGSQIADKKKYQWTFFLAEVLLGNAHMFLGYVSRLRSLSLRPLFS